MVPTVSDDGCSKSDVSESWYVQFDPVGSCVKTLSATIGMAVSMALCLSTSVSVDEPTCSAAE